MFGQLDDEKKKNPNTNGQSLMAAITGKKSAGPQANMFAGAPQQQAQTLAKPVAQTVPTPEMTNQVSTPGAPVAEPKGTLNQFSPSAQPMASGNTQPTPAAVTQNNSNTEATQTSQTYTGSLLNQIGNNTSAQASYNPSALQSAILGKGGATRGEANFNASTLSADKNFADQAQQVNQFAYQNTELNKQLAAQKAATAKAEADAKAAADLKAKTDADAAAKAASDKKAADAAAAAQAKAQADATAKAKAEQEAAVKASTVKAPTASAAVVKQAAPVSNVAKTGTTAPATVTAAPQVTAPVVTTAPVTPASPLASAITGKAPATPAPTAPTRIAASGNFDATSGDMSPAYQAQLQNDINTWSADKSLQDKDGNLDPAKLEGKLAKEYPELSKYIKDSKAAQVAEQSKAQQAQITAAQQQAEQAKAQVAQSTQQLQAAQAQQAQYSQAAAQASTQAQKQAAFADFMSSSFKDTPTGRVFSGDYGQLANYLNDPSMNEIYQKAMTGESLAGLAQMSAQRVKEANESAQRAVAQQQAQAQMISNIQAQQAQQNTQAQQAAQALAKAQADAATALQNQKNTAADANYQNSMSAMTKANANAVTDQAALGKATANEATKASLAQALTSGNPLQALAMMGVPGAAQQLANQNASQTALAQIKNVLGGQTVSNNAPGTVSNGNIASAVGGGLANAFGLPSSLGKLAGGILGKIF